MKHGRFFLIEMNGERRVFTWKRFSVLTVHMTIVDYGTFACAHDARQFWKDYLNV